MPSTPTNKLQRELEGYGIAKSCMRLFNAPPGPDRQNYLDLISAHSSNDDTPDGVAEAQGRPVLYFVDESRLTVTGRPAKQLMDGGVPVWLVGVNGHISLGSKRAESMSLLSHLRT